MIDTDGHGPEASPSSSPDPRDLLAHDIRAALSDVIGGLRLIDTDTLPEPSQVQLDRVQAASELLARLIEALVAGVGPSAAVDDGNMNLTAFLDDEIRRWRGVAHEFGTEIVLDRFADVPEIVSLPLLALRRILANLMSNALRHSSGSRVVLGAQLYEDRTLSLCVTDDGKGFPAALLGQVFEPSVRGDITVEGTGMGLHIAAAHAVAMGGTLRATNGPSGGARVTLTLPEDVWKSNLAAPSELPDLSGVRVLIADDQATNRSLAQAMLTRMGAVCEQAVNGIEALNWMSRERFDLALIDLEMPVLDGLGVFRQERLRQARGVAPPLCMLAITSHLGAPEHAAIIDAGADGVLTKPLPRIEVFGAKLSRHLEMAPDPGAWEPLSAPPLSAAILADLMMVAGPENGADLLEKMQQDLTRLAVDMRRSMEEDDLERLRGSVHAMLSICSAVGALPASEAARKLNKMAATTDSVDPLRLATEDCLTCLEELRAELETTHQGMPPPSGRV